MIRAFQRFLVKRRYPLLALTALLAIAAWSIPRQSDFDRSVINLIASDNPVLDTFRRLKRTFGGNEIVLAVYRDAELLAEDGSGIDRLTAISTRLESVEGVRSTLSLDKLMGKSIVSPDFGMAERMRALFEGYTHNADGTIAVVVCMLAPESADTPPRRQTIDNIRVVMSDLPDGLEKGLLTGEPVMLVDGFRFVEQDGNRLSIWSSLLLGVTILVCFRSLRWMLICVAVVQLSLLLTRASLTLLGLRLSMVSSMLTAVVTVVGVATVVHIIVRFRDAKQLGKRPTSALAATVQILSIPIFWACITDGVGFAALTSSSVGPVGDFGLMMGISCLAVLLSVWLLVPGLSTLQWTWPGKWPRKWLGTLPGKTGRSHLPASSQSEASAPPQAATAETATRSIDASSLALRNRLHAIADFVGRHPVAIMAGGSVAVLASIWGMQFLEVETDFTKNFRADTEIVRSYQFVEEHLGGAGVGDILIPADSRLTWSYLRRVRQLEERIEAESKPGQPLAGITKVLSLADAVLVAAPQLEVHEPAGITDDFIARGGLAVMRNRIPSFYDALHSADPEGGYFFRIMFRARQQQDATAKRRLIARLNELVAEYFPPAENSGAGVTGFYVLLTHLVDSIVQDQWKTFLVAIAGIGITMLVAFRSLPLALVALIPNALPILVVSGLMGWAKWLGWYDFRINMGSAMIAAVSLGLSIDSSIHYIFAFQRARRLGASRSEAIQAAHGTVGLAMIFATIALIMGFSVLATNQFTPTVYFGSLVSLAMLGGLLGNLVILPVLLRLFGRDAGTSQQVATRSEPHAGVI